MLRYIVQFVGLGLSCRSTWPGSLCELRLVGYGTVKGYDNQVQFSWAVELEPKTLNNIMANGLEETIDT